MGCSIVVDKTLLQIYLTQTDHKYEYDYDQHQHNSTKLNNADDHCFNRSANSWTQCKLLAYLLQRRNTAMSITTVTPLHIQQVFYTGNKCKAFCSEPRCHVKLLLLFLSMYVLYRCPSNLRTAAHDLQHNRLSGWETEMYVANKVGKGKGKVLLGPRYLEA